MNSRIVIGRWPGRADCRRRPGRPRGARSARLRSGPCLAAKSRPGTRMAGPLSGVCTSFSAATPSSSRTMKRVGAYGNIDWKEHTINVAQRGGKVSRLHFPNVPAPFNGIAAFTPTTCLPWREKLTNCAP